MPLRTPLIGRLACLLLVSGAFPVTAMAEDELGWMSASEINALPEHKQVDAPVWCRGAYHHPHLLDLDTGTDTVVTADVSRLTPDGLVELIGDVRIEQTGRRILAEHAWLNQGSGDFRLEGGIRAEGSEFTFIADDMEGNAREEEASLTGVRYALFDIHARGGAERILHEDRRVRIERGSFTTCRPGQRGWRLSARRIDLDREKGWGEARHVVLRVQEVPALYLPWVTFPIDDRRKTGLLFPSITTGDDNETDIIVPVYLNLHPQFDATLGLRHIHERGSGMENEFRYLTRLGQGSISHAWLYQDRRFDDQRRELGRWAHSGQIEQWELRADVNYVSDDFYFKDLDSGLDVRARTNLPRLGEARYRGYTWDALVRVQDWQTIDPALPDEDKPYRRLPQLRLSGMPPTPGPTRLEWFSDFTWFERDTSFNEDNIDGSRLHMEPAFGLPMRASWGYVEPRVRLYHTQYVLTGVDTLPSDRPNRSLVGTSVDAGLFFDRSINLFGNDYIQTLEPRLFYHRIPFKDQSDLPDFDSGELTFSWPTLFRENRFTGYDRIGDEEKVVAGLSSRLMSPFSGREALRLRTGQAWYLADRELQRRDAPADTSRRSPLVGDGTWYFADNWQLFAETQWDTEENEQVQSRMRIGYAESNRRILHAGLLHRPQDRLKQGELAAIWPLHDNWSMIGRWLYDHEAERSVETLYGLEFRDCCWQIRLLSLTELSDRTGDTVLESERTILLQVRMIGLGGLGGRVDNLMQRSIPEYRSSN